VNIEYAAAWHCGELSLRLPYQALPGRRAGIFMRRRRREESA